MLIKWKDWWSHIITFFTNSKIVSQKKDCLNVIQSFGTTRWGGQFTSSNLRERTLWGKKQTPWSLKPNLGGCDPQRCVQSCSVEESNTRESLQESSRMPFLDWFHVGTFILHSNISTCLRPTVSFPGLMIWSVVDLGPLPLFLFRDFWHFTVALAWVGGEKPYELKFKPVMSTFGKCIVHLWISCTPALYPWLTRKIWALAGYFIYLGIFLQLAYIYSFRHVFRQYPRNCFFSIIFAVTF